MRLFADVFSRVYVGVGRTGDARMRLFACVFSRAYVGMGRTGDARFCVSTVRDAMLIGGMMCLWNVSCHRYSAKSVSLMSPFLVSVSWNAKAARSEPGQCPFVAMRWYSRSNGR